MVDSHVFFVAIFMIIIGYLNSCSTRTSLPVPEGGSRTIFYFSGIIPSIKPCLVFSLGYIIDMLCITM